MASWGVLTIGCPLTLKLVFSTIARPVRFSTSRRSSWNSQLSSCETVWTRAEPLT